MSSTLTTIILCRNQAREISSLLTAAARSSDQVVLLDDFSDDIEELRQRAKKVQADVFQHALEGDFAAHRNSVFPFVRYEWTLFLDADELPEAEFWQEVRESIEQNETEAFSIRRRNIFLGKELCFGEAGEKRLIRLAKTRLAANRWVRAVHEVWDLDDVKSATLQSIVLHHQPGSIADFVKKLNRYAVLEQQERKDLSARGCLLQLALYPTGKFVWNYVLKSGWRDGFPGLALAFLMSYYSAIVRIQQYEKSL